MNRNRVPDIFVIPGRPENRTHPTCANSLRRLIRPLRYHTAGQPSSSASDHTGRSVVHRKRKNSKKAMERIPDNHLGNALAEEHDRGCVLVGYAFLEYQLYHVLTSRLIYEPNANRELIEKVIDPNDPRAFFGSGWAKCTVLRLWGIIDEEHYQILEKMRVLRNNFAHRPGAVVLSGSNIDPIVDLLNTPSVYKQLFDECVRRFVSDDPTSMWRLITGPTPFSHARVKFMSLCLAENSYLLDCFDAVKPDHIREEEEKAYQEFVRHCQQKLAESEGTSIDQA